MVFKEIMKESYFLKKKNYFFSQRIMMQISRLEKDKKVEDNIIKDIRNLFRLKKK